MTRRFTITILSFLSPFLVLAQDYTGPRLGNPVARITEPGNLIDLLVTIFQFLGGPIVVIGLIYAGYNLVSAQGDERKLEEGKKALVWVVVGAAIILGASLIQGIVEETFEGIFG
jgi:hypothetical protein